MRMSCRKDVGSLRFSIEKPKLFEPLSFVRGQAAYIYIYIYTYICLFTLLSVPGFPRSVKITENIRKPMKPEESQLTLKEFNENCKKNDEGLKRLTGFWLQLPRVSS